MEQIKAPLDSQLLIYPTMDCRVTGGYKNAKYRNAHGHIHYGTDFVGRYTPFDVVAQGNGTVLGVEKNQNSIGGVIVIKYDNVYNPKTKKVEDLIVRCYHIFTIKVKKNQRVKAYDVIGSCDNSHKWWNHIHLEVDRDTKYPFYTPQVAEASSKLLIQNGSNDRTLINPMDILVIGAKQACEIHPSASLVDRVADAPKYRESAATVVEDKKPNTSGAQQLVFPLKAPKITCGYKDPGYKVTYGFNHFGLDMFSAKGITKLYGLGNGTVIAAGWDGIGAVNGLKANSGCGYVLIVQYDNVYNHVTKKTCNVICTMMHLKAMPLVKKGDKVTTSTLLGYYGATGAYVTGAHLHIQFDSDTKYPFNCMPIGNSGHKILRKGYSDSTVDPCELLHLEQGDKIYYGSALTQNDKMKLQKIPYAD